MGKLLMTLRERTLLMNSETIKDYEKLKKLIEERPTIKGAELKNLDSKMQTFFRNMYSKVLKQSASEWSSNSAHPVDVIIDEEKTIQCQLCHQPIKNICYIVNKINENELIVGSDCVKNFEMNLGKPIEKLLEDMLKTKRLTILNESCNNIEDIINTWEYTLENFDVLIPGYLEKEYLELGTQIKKNYNNFIEKKNKKKNEDIIKTIEDLLEKREILIKKLENYVKDHKNDKYVVTRSMVKWLKQKNKHKVIKWLKSTGKVGMKTAHRIGEDNYLQSLVDDLNLKLKNTNIKIINFTPNYKGRKGYIYQYQNNLKLFCSYSNFLLESSWMIFNGSLNEDYDEMKNNLLSHSIPHQDSYQMVTNMLFNIIKKLKLSIHLFDKDFDQLFIYNNETDKYFIMDNFSSFINKNLNYIVKEENNNKNILSIIKLKNKKEYNKVDIEYLLEERYSREEINYLINQYN